MPIYPLNDVFTRKLKILKKFSLNGENPWSFMVKAAVLEKLMDMNCQSKNLFKIQMFRRGLKMAL